MPGINLAYLAQILANGLHMGAIYALLAWGYALTHSVTHRANLAHGAIFAFSGQTLTLAANFAYNALWLTLPLAIIFGGVAALALGAIAIAVMARIIIPRFARKAQNMMIAATLASAIVITETARLGSGARDFWLPPIGAAHVPLGPSDAAPAITLLQLVNIAFIFAVIAAGEYALRATSAGRHLRAVADDAGAAALLGTHAARVVRLSVWAGGLCAVIAGQLAVLHYGNMSFSSGIVFGLKVLFLASAGGFSSPLHAALGAFAYGEAEQLWDGYFPVLWREAFFYAFLAAMLVIRSGSGNADPAQRSEP